MARRLLHLQTHLLVKTADFHKIPSPLTRRNNVNSSNNVVSRPPTQLDQILFAAYVSFDLWLVRNAIKLQIIINEIGLNEMQNLPNCCNCNNSITHMYISQPDGYAQHNTRPPVLCVYPVCHVPRSAKAYYLHSTTPISPCCYHHHTLPELILANNRYNSRLFSQPFPPEKLKQHSDACIALQLPIHSSIMQQISIRFNLLHALCTALNKFI